MIYDLRPLQDLAPRWERWLPAGESLKKQQLAGKMPALPGSFAEVSIYDLLRGRNRLEIINPQS